MSKYKASLETYTNNKNKNKITMENGSTIELTGNGKDSLNGSMDELFELLLDQKVYEKAYFEALDKGRSLLRFKLNEQGEIEVLNEQ